MLFRSGNFFMVFTASPVSILFRKGDKSGEVDTLQLYDVGASRLLMPVLQSHSGGSDASKREKPRFSAVKSPLRHQ